MTALWKKVLSVSGNLSLKFGNNVAFLGRSISIMICSSGASFYILSDLKVLLSFLNPISSEDSLTFGVIVAVSGSD